MRKVIVIATAAAAAAALAVANIATATSSTTKTETFTEITTNPGSGVASLIATGGFTAGWTALLNGKRRQAFHFAGGKFTLVIGKASKHQNLNLTTCLYTKTGSGVYTLADGTGAYKGISGSGKISFSLRAAYPLVRGKCPSSDQPGGNGNPAAIQYTDTASGPVSLG